MIKFLLISLNKGSCLSPYLNTRLLIGEDLLGSLVGAGAGLVGNLLGFSSNKSANQTNIEIARMNNESQYRMFKEQQAYNEMMWNKQNEYNAPKAQVERLLAAGINPSAVFGSGSTTPAGELTAPQLPSLQQARVNPFVPDTDSVSRPVQAYFQNKLLNSQAEGVGIDTQAKKIDLQYKVQRILLDMQEQRQRISESLTRQKLSDAERDELLSRKRDLDNRIKLFEENFEELSRREKLQNDVLKNQADDLLAGATLKRAQASFQNVLRQWYPRMAQSQIDQMDAQVGNILQDTCLKIAQKENVSKQTIRQQLENDLMSIDLFRKKLLHKGRNGNEVTTAFWQTIDVLTDAIFNNLRLFK